MSQPGTGPSTSSGCRCIWLGENFVDTSDCPVHPVTCEAIHPETGLGCVHGPGHGGQHAASITYMWPAGSGSSTRTQSVTE